MNLMNCDELSQLSQLWSSSVLSRNNLSTSSIPWIFQRNIRPKNIQSNSDWASTDSTLETSVQHRMLLIYDLCPIAVVKDLQPRPRPQRIMRPRSPYRLKHFTGLLGQSVSLASKPWNTNLQVLSRKELRPEATFYYFGRRIVPTLHGNRTYNLCTARYPDINCFMAAIMVVLLDDL